MNATVPAFRVYSDPERKYSRCLVPASREEDMSRADGWNHEFDWDGDRASGWTKAAVELGLFPEDYDDRMSPVAQSQPAVLYRSVSVAELHDVLERGAVYGGGNGFNGFDSRPFVFFSPEVTARVIWQGEEIDRAAAYATMKSIGTGLPYDEARAAFKAAYPAERRALEERMNEAPFTSAILRTRPISGALHYSTEHGRSGMGEEDEYGFLPGVVRIEHVESLTLVRKGVPGEAYSAEALKAYLGEDASPRP